MQKKQGVRVSAELSFDRAMTFINRMVDMGFTVLATQEGATWVIYASMNCGPDDIEKIEDDVKEDDVNEDDIKEVERAILG